MEYYGILAGICVMLASVFGSVIGICIKNITHRINDMILGFAAGVMLTAAFVGLLPYAFEQKTFLGIAIGVIGILTGSIFMSMVDKFVPHIHFENDNIRQSEAKSKSMGKVLLLVIAIAIHNIPEGLATGIAFSNGFTKNALLMAISMIIQKIPEGLIVAVPLLAIVMKKTKSFAI
ncbi:MAG: ZIP family metal transporter, partial [Oscillospiraceae bacterium]